MTGVKDLKTLLLVAALLLAEPILCPGARCKKDVTFVYGVVGGEALLPCAKQPTDCAAISWVIYKSDRTWSTADMSSIPSHSARRISIAPGCSLSVRELIPEDAGSYVCLLNGNSVADVYLSLLAIRSPSTITDLRPGGTLSLSCVLFTYYNAGSCRSYSNTAFKLSWAGEGGAEFAPDERHEVVTDSPCNVTLLIHLQREDHNKKWRCLASMQEAGVTVFQDIASTFLLHTPQTEQTAVSESCLGDLPVSRIGLCVALPLMVAIVGVYTWKVDRHRRIKARRSRYELKEIS